VMAFIIAGIVQRASGQLSLFHETAALHLGVLTIWSALVGLITEPKLESSRKTALFTSRRGDVAYITTSHSGTAQILIAIGYAVLVPVVGIMVMVDGQCHATPGVPDSDYPHITWIMLFGIPLHGATGEDLGIFSLNDLWFPFVPILFVALGVLFVTLMKCVFSWESVRVIPCGSVLGYVVFWVEEVVGIERSLKANPSLSEENMWGFGQIIPLVLLIPFFELIKEQLSSSKRAGIEGSDHNSDVETLNERPPLERLSVERHQLLPPGNRPDPPAPPHTELPVLPRIDSLESLRADLGGNTGYNVSSF